MTGGETQLLFGVEFRMNTWHLLPYIMAVIGTFFSIKSFKGNYITILYTCQCQKVRFEIMQSIRLTEINKRNCSLLMKT